MTGGSTTLSRWRRLWLLSLVALAIGCGGQTAPRSQRATQGPAAPGFPVTMEDAQGVSVTVERRPERIVSAAPVVTEILFAVGAGNRVVAVSDQCNYPPEVKQLPRIGGFFSPSVERALAARPDLVVGSRGNPPDFLAAMRGSGCPVYTIDPKTLDDIYDVIGKVSRLVGEEESGERLVAEMKARLAAVAAKLKDVPESRRPTAFIFLQVEPIWTAGAGTFQDDAIRAAGARNAAGRLHGFTAFGGESLMAADPDYIILSTMDGDPDRMKREVTANPVYRELSAVKAGRIIVLDGDEIMRPGPRVVDAVEALARELYPERFSQPARPSR